MNTPHRPAVPERRTTRADVIFSACGLMVSAVVSVWACLTALLTGRDVPLWSYVVLAALVAVTAAEAITDARALARQTAARDTQNGEENR